MILAIGATIILGIVLLWVYIWLLNTVGKPRTWRPFVVVTLLLFPLWLALAAMGWGFLFFTNEADLQWRALGLLCLLGTGALGINRILFSNTPSSPNGSAEGLLLYLLMLTLFIVEIVVLVIL